jgi:hypothetical protein
VPIYLVPTNDGTGKRFVRRPHPPPTTAPLPDDFDAITETRDSTTVYDEAADSALDIDYDAITVAPLYAQQQQPPIPIHAPIPSPAPVPVLVPTSPPPNPTSPRQRRAASPSQSLLGFSPDVRGSRRGGGPSAGKARSVAGGDRDRDRERERAGQRRSLGAANALNMPTSPMPLPVSFPPGRGPAKGRNDLVEKLVLEDGPDRTISVWRESVAKNSGETGRGGRGAGAGASADDGAAAGTGAGTGGGEGEGRSDLDSHVGRRRVSADSRRRVDSLAQGSPSLKGKGHRSRESADFTEVRLSPSSTNARC